MFNTLRKFFGRRVEEAEPQAIAIAVPLPPFPPVLNARPEAAPKPIRVDVAAKPAAPTASVLSLPLRSVLGRLPAELTSRIRQLDVGEAEVVVPMQKVLTQLPSGSVRMSFGELRQASPPGTFTLENDRDKLLIELPLHEILARVNPGALARRAVQKHIELPPEVTGPFGGQNRVTITTEPLRSPTAPVRKPGSGDTAFRRVNVPARPQTEAMPEENLFKRNGAPSAPDHDTEFTPVPHAPAVPLPATIPAPAALRTNVPPREPSPQPLPEESIFKRAAAPSVPASQPPPAPVARVTMPPAHASPQPLEDEPIFKRVGEPVQQVPAVPQPASIPAPAALRNLAPSTPPAAPMPADHQPGLTAQEPIKFNPVSTPAPQVPGGETTYLTASLLDLSREWPEAIREEITHLNASAALVGLPLGAVEIAIKRGKVAFHWRLIRGWIKPPLPSGRTSPHDAVILELPMNVVTPIFMAHLRTARPQRKVAIDENIPNLFSGGSVVAEVVKASPTPVAPVPPPSSPDTNYYTFSDSGDAPEPAMMAATKAPTPGTSFLQRYATPNEIVSKAAALDGVGGSLIALPDGLLVASKIPKDLNADTLAAFLPQIFGRVSQSTRELRMGELNNLNFTVGNIPWKIFRVGAIYFAVFGMAGQVLPTAQLAGIAAELDRKAK